MPNCGIANANIFAIPDIVERGLEIKGLLDAHIDE